MFRPYKPAAEPLRVHGIPLVVAAILYIIGRGLLALQLWGDFLVFFAFGLAIVIVVYLQRRHKLQASALWLRVEARVEDVQIVGPLYRISHSFSMNGETLGSDIEIAGNESLVVPSERWVGQILQIRVNPKRMNENFVLRRSLPGLRPSRHEWIANA